MSDINTEVVTREVGERVDVMMNIEQSTIKELGGGSFTCTITTSSTDRSMESIDTQGITLTNYMQNPVVLYGHDYSGLPIGKCIKLTQFKNKLTATFQLAVDEYPFAKTVAAMIKGGYLNAVSIGGVVREWNEDYTIIKAMDMAEFSVVPVPANPEALITSRSLETITGKSVKEIKAEYTDFVEQIKIASSSIDKDALTKHIKSLKDLTAVLERAAEMGEKELEAEVITLTLRKTAGQISQTGQNIIRVVKAQKKD